MDAVAWMELAGAFSCLRVRTAHGFKISGLFLLNGTALSAHRTLEHAIVFDFWREIFVGRSCPLPCFAFCSESGCALTKYRRVHHVLEAKRKMHRPIIPYLLVSNCCCQSQERRQLS